MFEAGTVVPEFRWPITPLTLASTSFCATAVPCFGSAASSSGTITNLTTLPLILKFSAFNSSMAIFAPFSLSLPKCAEAPEIGATWPILITSCAPALPAKARATASGMNLILDSILFSNGGTKQRRRLEILAQGQKVQQNNRRAKGDHHVFNSAVSNAAYFFCACRCVNSCA